MENLEQHTGFELMIVFLLEPDPFIVCPNHHIITATLVLVYMIPVGWVLKNTVQKMMLGMIYDYNILSEVIPLQCTAVV